jgi:hypothetical protein
MIVIIEFEFQYRADPREAVKHRGNERSVPQPGKRIGWD